MTCDPLRRTKIARLEFQRALMASVHLGTFGVSSFAFPLDCKGVQYDIRCNSRGNFGSQTSDDMDRWKSRGGRVRQKKRKSQKKEDEGTRNAKRWKSRETRCSANVSDARKVGSLKRRARGHLGR